ncbi:MAG: hypothetical protein NVS3B24_21310 [Candidatus Dormibacteria bacterium]
MTSHLGKADRNSSTRAARKVSRLSQASREAFLSGRLWAALRLAEKAETVATAAGLSARQVEDLAAQVTGICMLIDPDRAVARLEAFAASLGPLPAPLPPGVLSDHEAAVREVEHLRRLASSGDLAAIQRKNAADLEFIRLFRDAAEGPS